ncbi:ATP-binding cassette domain-containing protein [Pseudonocardia alaniniphila]|uniref:ATP-binding cassette domain-containing protein n=1 Tax=Pseudonocardia alaniniphila TaxID=75291 RepID=A0ABS9TKJ0_9PSEU|nr:ATP-binding cassette domain-containing protein [Pseudonocardia alaniniphila]MCH6169054.1 ATP-binding cassette domain-containing protein [Pseudonocardia alaniniphila]
MAEAEGFALRLDGLSRRYRTRWALRDCSLELPRGRVSALVGSNGAGKTTLFMLATGLLRPTSGTIDVLGADPARTGMPAGASFLAQDKPLYRTFRVAEVLRAAAALNSHARWDAGYAARLIDEAGIGPQDRVRELSPGQRARVALAVALGRRPELLSGHRHLAGPATNRDDLAGAAVVHASTAGRQTTALVRGTEAPPAFRAERPTLDDLVLAYLREQESAA